VCDGELEFKWAAGVLDDRYKAEYYECRSCRALQVPDPVWLAEAYKREAEPLIWNPDTGRFRRNYTVFCYLKALAAAGLPMDRALDYGGGYGLLTQMLVDAGVNAWLHDPYVTQPYFAGERVVPRLEVVPDASYDVITSFEVFEHLTNPRPIGEEFRRLLRPGGAVVLTTCLYEPGTHGPDWYYLHPNTGQHILFWSRTALEMFAARYGFSSVGYLPATPGLQCIILADRPANDLAGTLAKMEDQLRSGPVPREAADGWLLTRLADGPRAPDVVSTVQPTGGQPCAS
jgi:SAM-dependent methyltransferase